MTDRLVGKILKDEETVASYNIEEKGYVVCMVNKVSDTYSCSLESYLGILTLSI
jgi:UV excision repair protein RAD23